MPAPVMLFASGPDDPRARRPTDVALAATSLLLLLLSAVLTQIAADLDRLLYEFFVGLPDVLNGVWRLAVWAALSWSVALCLAAAIRDRLTLVRDVLLGVAAAVLIAAFAGAIITGEALAAVTNLFDLDGPPTVPPGALTLSAAAIAVAAPYLTRPLRRLGWWLLAGQLVAALVLGMSLPTGVVMAIAIGLLAASIVHLAMGSPGGHPTAGRIDAALHDLGVDVRALSPAQMQAAGVVRFTAIDANGPLDIKVYGRDAWDAQVLANLWRLVWYRGTQRTARLSRLELVEHEGFIALLAERAGVRASRLVTAGSAGQGDALVVVRRDGVPLSEARPPVTDEAIDGLWHDVGHLHEAGVTHGRIDLDRIVVRADGTLGLGDLSSGVVAVDTATDRILDRAQLVALSIVLVGEERAIAGARRAIGDEGLTAMLPSLQEAALPPGVRDELHHSDVELEDVRQRTTDLLGADEQPLTKLRRVTWGSVINLALLGIAAAALVSVFGNIDLAEFADALRDASWWWLAFALVLAQIPRVPAAVSTMGSIQRPLPLGPLTALQFAICYVNLAIPSTAARVAINVRFLQRFGVPPTEAMTAGVIDSVSGFVVQISLFLLLFFTSDLDLGLSTDPSDLSGLGTIVLIVLALLLAAVVVVISVGPIRRRVVKIIDDARAALDVLRSPTKLVQLFGGNVVSQVLFAVAIGACAEAFGAHVSLGELLLINTVVSLFAGLLPIPGGVGVSEAGLTFGLTAAGVPAETALAIALASRFTSFYLPPIWGWFSYRWLIDRRYL